MERTKRQQDNSIDNDNKRRLTVDLVSSSKNCTTHFEDLSNEIIYEIFEFLDFYHTYDAFFDLNIRFRHLLVHSSLPIHINLPCISRTTFHRFNTNIIKPYQRQIRSLHLSNPFIVEHLFLSTNTPLEFIRLEKLSLAIFDSIYLENLLLHLVHLPRLFSLGIKCLHDTLQKTNFYHQIFRLPVLKYCKFSCKSYRFPEMLPFTTTEFSPIEYLVISHGMRLEDLLALLSYVPQLRFFSFRCGTGFPNQSTLPCSIVLNHLTHVSVYESRLTFATFQWMIKNLFHQVQVLYISISYDIMYFNANLLQRLILSYMPYLRIFNMNICYSSFFKEDLNRYITSVNEFNSSFWVERQWFFEYQITISRSWHSIFFYSTNPYRQKIFKLHGEIKENDNQNSHNNGFDSVNCVYIDDEKAIINCEKYFPNVTKLSSSYVYGGKIENVFFTNLKTIIPLQQLTKLIIDYDNICFSQVIELLRYMPKIHTLKLMLTGYPDIDLISPEKNETFQLVCKINNIKKITVSSHNIIEVTKFLVRLSPRLQHLKIIQAAESLAPVLLLLLSKDNNNTPNLSSLCISNVFTDQIETLKTFIQSENLLHSSFIKVLMNQNISHDNDIFLWW